MRDLGLPGSDSLRRFSSLPLYAPIRSTHYAYFRNHCGLNVSLNFRRTANLFEELFFFRPNKHSSSVMDEYGVFVSTPEWSRL